MILQRIILASPAHDNAHVHQPYSAGHPRAIIEKLRQLRGFNSTRALALAAGIPQPTLARYLNGTSETMEVASFQALAKVLQVTLSELLGEIPISSGGALRELTQLLGELPEPEREAWLAAGRAMAKVAGNRS